MPLTRSTAIVLAERLAGSDEFATAWNFAPPLEAPQRPVGWIVSRFGAALGREVPSVDVEVRSGPPEAARLGLDPSFAAERLGWVERWELERGVDAAAAWYRRVVFEGADARDVTVAQIAEFEASLSRRRTSTAAG